MNTGLKDGCSGRLISRRTGLKALSAGQELVISRVDDKKSTIAHRVVSSRTRLSRPPGSKNPAATTAATSVPYETVNLHWHIRPGG